MRKLISLLVTAIIISTLCISCQKSIYTSEASSKTTPDQIDLYILHNKQEALDTYTRLADAFHKKHPNISIHYETPTNYYLELQKRRSKNQMPDIYYATPIEANAGLLMDLSKEPFMAKVNPIHFETVTKPGEYFFPVGYAGVGVIYNKDVFKANNLTPPKTLDELTALHKALQQKNIYTFALGYKDTWIAHFSLRPAYYAVYGKYLNWNTLRFKHQTSFADTTEWRTVTDVVRDYVYAYGNTDTAFERGYMDACSMVAYGNAAMILQGSWATAIIHNYNQDVSLGFIPLPVSNDSKNRKISYYCDYYLSISAETKYPKEAKMYLNFLTSPEAVKIYTDNSMAFSAVKNAPIPKDSVSQDIKAYVDKQMYISNPTDGWPNRFYVEAEKLFIEYILDGITYQTLIKTLDEEWEK